VLPLPPLLRPARSAEAVCLHRCRLLLRAGPGREVRESMFEQVSELFHDLDAGMLPVSVLFPYLPIPQHRRRDRCALAAASIVR
jgi:hypothetical protein